MVSIRPYDLGTALGSVSILDFSGFLVLEHRINGQIGIKSTRGHVRFLNNWEFTMVLLRTELKLI